MNRRQLLFTVGGILPAVGGCLGSRVPSDGVTDTPTPSPPAEREASDCSNPDRPEPQKGSGTFEPATYPSQPESLADDEEMIQYVKAYERAYRRNALIEEFRNDLNDFEMGVDETWVHAAPSDTAIVRLRYTYHYQVESTMADSPNTYASYYVDESTVIRAEKEGLLDDEDALNPDPLEEGVVLECFG